MNPAPAEETVINEAALKADRNRRLIFTILVLVILVAASWLLILVLLGKPHEEGFSTVLRDIGLEFFKIVIVAVVIGYGLEFYIKRLMGDPSESLLLKIGADIKKYFDHLVDPAKEMLAQNGIVSIYSSRGNAIEEFCALVEDHHIREITIMGISLREFLFPTGTMRRVWEKIEDRLKDEHTRHLAASQRLRVKLLLLDPKSEEGHFRYKIEEPFIGPPGSDNDDVTPALKQIERSRERIYHGGDAAPNKTAADKKAGDTNHQQFLQARLYAHCPFSFILATETVVYVEQYYYHTTNHSNSLPLIRYRPESSQYQELTKSLDAIWKSAHKKRIDVGIAVPLEQAKIKNIYRREDRAKLTKRQCECIKKTHSGTIDILAISGRHYTEAGAASVELRKIKRHRSSPDEVTIRFALLNPTSQQAIFRAVADSYRANDVQGGLCKWDWEQHRESLLYTHITAAITRILQWKRDGVAVELRLYSGATACAMLLTSDAGFVEQYTYGRSRLNEEGFVLGGEYPLIEYARSAPDAESTIEHEILDSTFEIVWNSYSVPVEDYLKRNRDEEFQKNLIRLWDELGCQITSNG